MSVQTVAQGAVLTPGGPIVGEVVVDAGRIVDVRRVTSGGGRVRWVCPGFVDLQFNGSDGVDLTTEPQRVGDAARRLPLEGTTAFVPTVVTCSEARRAAAIAALGSSPSSRGAVPVGLHLEGPVLAPTRRGAHPAEHLRHPAAGATEGWSPERGVTMVTLAPELPGAIELIAELSSVGVVVALGHTDATAEQFQAGLDAGATHVTHLFNAMRPFGHRDPGPIGVVLADDTVTAGLICDFVHVDPVAVRMAWRALGPERLVLVTDAVAARDTGSPPDGATPPAVRTADGVLAGSTVRLDQALRNLVAATGSSVPDAVRTVTATPAGVIGATDRGVLVPGARADITVLDHELRVVECWVGGRRVV